MAIKGMRNVLHYSESSVQLNVSRAPMLLTGCYVNCLEGIWTSVTSDSQVFCLKRGMCLVQVRWSSG